MEGAPKIVTKIRKDRPIRDDTTAQKTASRNFTAVQNAKLTHQLGCQSEKNEKNKSSYFQFQTRHKKRDSLL